MRVRRFARNLAEQVKKNDVLLEIYAERTTKLNDAHGLALSLNPVTIEGMLLHKVPEF